MDNLHRLTIEDMTHDGRGVAREDGKVVFVAGAVVGEEVLCKIVKQGVKYSEARAEVLEKASPERIEPGCGVYEKCGGCAYGHITYKEELRQKQRRVKTAFERIAKLDVEVMPIVGSEKTEHYRNKITLPFSVTAQGRCFAGFYERGSHRVVKPIRCTLFHEEFFGVISAVESWANRHGITVYDEKSGRGVLQKLSIRIAESTGEISLMLIINDTRLPNAGQLIDALLVTRAKIVSVGQARQTGKGVICSYRNIYGNEHVIDNLCGNKLVISPVSFYQVNPPQAQALYETAVGLACLNKDMTVLDLFCGIGSITLYLAKLCKEVYGAEIAPEAIKNAESAATLNKISNVTFKCADAENAVAEYKGSGIIPNVIFADPPRSGLTPALIKGMAELNPEKIIYISCDTATMARDCALFDKLGYTTVKVCPIDMFPRTAHVETVCLLERK